MSEKKESPISPYLVWMDLEMTGLDPVNDVVLEIATVITDNQLNVVAEGPNLAIHYAESTLEVMGDWVRKQHTQSGLLARVRESNIQLADAEDQTLAFIQRFVAPQTSPLCGNSIHMDRFFLTFHMKKLIGHLHYRNIDVSSIKELAKRWAPDLMPAQPKKSNHLARDDIFESIEELRHYRGCFLKPTSLNG